jgi:hypothetical protein
MSVFHKQPAFNNVVATGTANIPNLHQGDICQALVLKLGGTALTKAMIAAIRVKLGGKSIVDGVSGNEMDKINSYMKRTANANYLVIWFSDPNARTIDGEDIGGIDTSLGYGTFSIEVDIAGATAPTLECWMLKSPVDPAATDRAVFRAYTKATQTIGAAGTFSLTPALGSVVGNLICRNHFFHANLTQLDVKKAGLDIWDQGEVAVTQFLQNSLNRTTQAGHLAYDPIFDNNQSNSVSTTRGDGTPASLEFRGKFSAGDTVTMVSEIYTAINRM